MQTESQRNVEYEYIILTTFYVIFVLACLYTVFILDWAAEGEGSPALPEASRQHVVFSTSYHQCLWDT